MIVTKKIDFVKLYGFTKKNGWFLFLASALTVLITYFFDDSSLKPLSFPAGVVGTSLAFLIGFRNNMGYNRWWEARKIWGKLVNDSRYFGLKVISFLSDHWNPNLTNEEIERAQKRLIYRHIAFVWATNKHLRKSEWDATLEPFLTEEEFKKLKQEQHIPYAILKYQAIDLKELFREGYFEDFRYISFEEIMENFNDALGKSERIKNTVFPMQYNWYMQYTLWVFLLILPLSLAGQLESLWFFAVAMIIGYTFIVLEYLGRQIENPFENHPSDTPLNALSRTIEINLKEVLGEKDLPPKIEPTHGSWLL